MGDCKVSFYPDGKGSTAQSRGPGIAGSEPGVVREVEVLTQPTHDQDGSSVRIVVADDQRIFRESLRVFLQSVSGFEVVGDCSDAQSALNMGRMLKPHILLIEHNLVRGDGMEAVARMQSGELSIKVIVLCSVVTREEVVSILRAGVSGIVLKAEPAESLVECIGKVVRGQYWLGSGCMEQVIEALSRPRVTSNSRFGLTSRELEIVQAVLDGYSNPEIAATLGLSLQTVKHHLSHVFDKLGVYSRLELALFAVNHHIGVE